MTFKQLCDWAPLSSFFTKDTLSGQQYYYYYYYYYYTITETGAIFLHSPAVIKPEVIAGQSGMSFVLLKSPDFRRFII